MSGLDEIGVWVESATGNVEPLLHEIRHALIRISATAAGDDTVIDLRSLPLAPGEEERIETILGVGEVRAELNALGPTTVQETRIAGVWIVTHCNANDEIVAKFIEVTRMPSILLAKDEDLQRGLDYLNHELGICQTTFHANTTAESQGAVS